MKIALVYLEPIAHEPMGLLYIGTALKRAGHEVWITDTQNRPDFAATIADELAAECPDLVGISATTPYGSKANAVARTVKEVLPGCPVVLGGPHPTVLPRCVLREPAVDFAVIGEGERTTVDLVAAIEAGADPAAVPGLGLRRDGETLLTGARQHIPDLDDLPWVDRGLLKPAALQAILGSAPFPVGFPMARIITVRGCPYTCTFCQPTVDLLFGKRVRRRSAENVVAEIKELQGRYGINGLWFTDDTFTLSEQWVTTFCDELAAEGIRITWYVNGRFNTADLQLFRKMRRSGCVGVVMALESGCDRVREQVIQKRASRACVERAFALAKTAGLLVQTNIMLGSPTETMEEVEESVRTVDRLQPDYLQASFTTLMPGARLFDEYGERYYDEQANFDSWWVYDTEARISMNTDLDMRILAAIRDQLESRYHRDSAASRTRLFWAKPHFRRALWFRWRSLARGGWRVRRAWRVLLREVVQVVGSTLARTFGLSLPGSGYCVSHLRALEENVILGRSDVQLHGEVLLPGGWPPERHPKHGLGGMSQVARA